MTGSTALADLLARLESNRLKPVPVDVPGLGVVYVMPLTVADIDKPKPTPPEGEPEDLGNARAVMRVMCDENGERFDDNPELLALLRKQPWKVLNKLSDAATGAADAGNG